MTTNHNEEPLIQVKNLGKSFGSISVLSGIDLDIYKGDVVFVVGPSGSGKSTFLRCLNRLEEPRPRGRSSLRAWTSWTQERPNIDKHRQKMGMVFQQFNLFPHMTILKNLTLAPGEAQGRSQKEGGSASATGPLKESGPGRPGACLPQPALRRTEAANRHRARALHEAGRDAVR